MIRLAKKEDIKYLAPIYKDLYDNADIGENWTIEKSEELLNYWNMLESGRDSHTGKMYSWIGRKKTKQQHFSRNIAPNLISNAMTQSIAYG